MKSLQKPWVYHTFFWVGYFIFNTLRWGSYFDDYLYSVKSNLVEFPIHLILVYFNLYFLLPKYIPARFIRYIIYLFLAIFVMSLIRIVLTYELVTTVVWRESTIPVESPYGFNYILAVFIGELYVVGITMAIQLIINWVNSQKKTLELQRRNHETELSFSKSQVQPHFFFNTLNNLYSLTLDKSDKAPDTVLKLSELMSYVVYRGKAKKVSLEEEIQFIQNYIDIERLRYGDKLDAQLNISGDIQDKYLPPLILMPFLENSFKHGIHYHNDKITIKIQVEVAGDTLTFKTINRINNFADKNSRNKTSGIGIQNTRRRLELLYGQNFRLDTEDRNNYFNLTLTITLYEN